MANNLTLNAEKLLLDWLMTGNAVTRPTSWFLALFTSATDQGTGGTEVTGNGYARQAITYPAATQGTTSTSTANSGAINFTSSTGGSGFGTVTHVAIYDAATGGNRLWQGPLTTPKANGPGDTISVATG